MIANNKIHLICNAHLDPVWLWEWQEGAAEAISTFRTAAELCEKYDSFIFNHNEVTLYKWVQEYEPALFKRIQKLVKAGRWHIMGGWYLQPDCNMPSGESFVRQILMGKTYFKKHFGVEPSTAINFDPFGHSQGLVQILAKSGYDSYLFGRPMTDWLDLPGEDFVWKGFDGSEILAMRFFELYCTSLGKAEKEIVERVEKNRDRDTFAVLWGVGNHGGGPSKKDVKDLEKLIATGKYEMQHSTPERYFADISKNKDKLPVWNSDLNPWAIGCYSSMVRVKQLHRKLENELFSLEKMVSTAAANGLLDYPKAEIDQICCDLMNIEFHDTLPGTAIEPVEEMALNTAGRGLQTASELKARAFFTMAAGQKKAKEGEIPIMVYNPQPYDIEEIVECEFSLQVGCFYDTFTDVKVYQNGKPLPTQVERERCNVMWQTRKMVVFKAVLKPGMNRFDCKLDVISKRPAKKLKPGNGKIVFKNDTLSVVINTRTGLVDSYKVEDRELVKKGAFEPIVLSDNEDPWRMDARRFGEVAGKFKLMTREKAQEFSGHKGNIPSVRVIEDGDVRSVVEAVFSYNNSFICQRYYLPKSGTQIGINSRVYWNEKDKTLKLSVPLGFKSDKHLGQTAYGVSELPNNGDECISQKWACAISSKANKALSCINDGTYASDCSEAGMSLTLLRSPGYAAHPARNELEMPRDRFSPRIDQGMRMFNFWFDGGKVDNYLNGLDRNALIKNEKPMAVSFFPDGGGKKPKNAVVLSNNSINLAAMKFSEKGKKIVMRFFEPNGKTAKATARLPITNQRISLKLNPFEIKTIVYDFKTGSHYEADLLERKI